MVKIILSNLLGCCLNAFEQEGVQIGAEYATVNHQALSLNKQMIDAENSVRCEEYDRCALLRYL